MNYLYSFLLVVAFGLLICFLRIFPFREKKSTEPVRTAKAVLTNRQVTTGADRTGRSSGLGYNYLLTFETAEGEILNLFAHDTQWGALREGMEGTLTWQGRYFTDFIQEV